MRPRTLLVLLVVVLGLGAFIWLYERDLPSSEERAERAKRLFALEREEVTEVVIEREGQAVRLVRVGGGEGEDEEDQNDGEEGEDGVEDEAVPPPGEWRIEAPAAYAGARADAGAVDQLLDALLTVEKRRTLEDVDRKAVGLDQPRLAVRLVADGRERALELGADVPTGGGMIVGFAGEPAAYVVSGLPMTELEREPGAWRDPQLFTGDREAVERITLTRPEDAGGGEVVLARRGDAFWIEKPIADRADRDAVDGLLAALSGLRADEFVDSPPPPAELGLAPPRAVVTAVPGAGGEPFRVEIGAPVGGAAAPAPSPDGAEPHSPVYARVGGRVVETSTDFASSLARAPEAWRSRRLSGLEVFQVESLRAEDGGGAVAIERSGTDWKRGDDLISYTSVSDLLYALTSAEAERLLSPEEARQAGAALDKPALTVTLKGGAAGDETLTLYPATAQGAPARASGREAVLLLPVEKLGEVQGLVAGIRQAEPLPKADAAAEEPAAED